MNKPVLTVMLTAIMLMLQPGTARAEGAIEAASGIVEEFHSTELKLLMEAGGEKLPAGLAGPAGLTGPADPADHRASLAEVREKTLSELKTIGIAETPGLRRAGRIYGLIDTYTGGRIESLKHLQAKLQLNERGLLDAAILKLITLRETRLKELDESLKSEAREKETRKPVPVMDRSPYEGTNGDGQGMWYR